MSETREVYNLDTLNKIGGDIYNHSGQVIRTPDHGSCGGWLYLGDDYGDYSPLDALIKWVVERPMNYGINGEVTNVVNVTPRYGHDYLEVTSIYEGETSTDEIYYEHLDVECIVNHNASIEVKRKSA